MGIMSSRVDQLHHLDSSNGEMEKDTAIVSEMEEPEKDFISVEETSSGLTYDLHIEDGESAVGDISEGQVVEPSEINDVSLCIDDPNFRYMGNKSYNCAHIRDYSPEKCMMEHSKGHLVGELFCPVSCNMVEECKAAILNEKVEVKSGLEPHEHEVILPKSNQNGLHEHEETVDAELQLEIGNFDYALCVDDHSFRYMGNKSYNCAHIREKSPDKCEIEYKGAKIGLVFCPVSCNMVDECKSEMINEEEVDKLLDEAEASNESSSQELQLENEIGTFDDALCVDDHSFRYMGNKSYNCAHIREKSPDKCEMEYKGAKIGLVFCPVSCNMVDVCKSEVINEDEEATLHSDDDESTPLSSEQVESQKTKDACIDKMNNCAVISSDQCRMENNGQLFGVVVCPVSCNMVEECKSAVLKQEKGADRHEP
jgi:hypothetical protein